MRPARILSRAVVVSLAIPVGQCFIQQSTFSALSGTGIRQARACRHTYVRRSQLSCAQVAPDGKARVVISGAGPAGLMLAHLLLKRGDKYQVSIYESRRDPRQEPNKSYRQYNLGLGVRGRTSLQKVEGLWDAIQAHGVQCDKFSLHIGKKTIGLRQTSPQLDSTPSTIINRGVLCATLLEELIRTHRDDLQLHFNAKCAAVDLNARQVTIERKDGPPEKVEYDLLVGSDGVRSVVRQSLVEQVPGFKCDTWQLPGNWKVLHQRMPKPLAPDSVHIMGASKSPIKGDKSKFGLFLIPAPKNQTCILVNWENSTRPDALLAETNPAKVTQLLNARLPYLDEGITEEAGQQFVEQRPSVAMVVECSAYTDHHRRAMIIGDAAHSTGGTSGQGCNSALQDAVALDALLTKTGDDIPQALELYSAQRVPEGKALLDLSLNNAPRGTLLRLAFLAWSAVEKFLASQFPKRFSPPLINLLTQTLVPFSEIVRKKRFWLNIIRKSNRSRQRPSAEGPGTQGVQVT